MEYELLAVISEQLSLLLVAFLKANGAKNVGRPLVWPRPRRSDEANSKPLIGFREFAKQITPPKKG